MLPLCYDYDKRPCKRLQSWRMIEVGPRRRSRLTFSRIPPFAYFVRCRCARLGCRALPDNLRRLGRSPNATDSFTRHVTTGGLRRSRKRETTAEVDPL